VSRGRRAIVALVVVASACCAVAAHVALSSGGTSTPGALVALIPLAVLGIAFSRRLAHPAIGIALVVLAALAAWLGWGLLRSHFTDLFFAEHAGMMLLLAIVFGRTLLPGREPLVTGFARAVHGELDAAHTRYARGVTVAWTAFFVLLFVASCALYLGHELEAWSLLANIVTPVAVALLFVLEYAVRVRALPHYKPAGILAGVRAFRRHVAGVQAPR
jgi:uncharacterized membrane protein